MKTLAEAYQIKLVPAYEAADGTRFHDVTEARDFTRKNMLDFTIRSAVKQNPEFARLDATLLREFLLLTGVHVGNIMNEPLEVRAAKAEVEASPKSPLEPYAAPTLAKMAEPAKPAVATPEELRQRLAGARSESAKLSDILRATDEQIERDVEAAMRA